MLKGVTAVGQVIDIFKKNKVIWVHTQVLEGDNTLLGNTRNSKELFKIKMCDVFEMNLITKIVDVHHRYYRNIVYGQTISYQIPSEE